MVFDNSVTDGKSKPNAVSGFLGGKEGIKYFLHVLFTDAVPGILDTYFYTCFFLVKPCGQGQLSIAIHCICRVDDQVEEHSLYLGWIQYHHGKLLIKIHRDFDVVKRSLFFHQRDAAPQQIVYTAQRLVGHFMAGKVQQSADNVSAAVGLDNNFVDALFDIIAKGAFFQQKVRIGDNALEWIVQLMRDIGGKLPDERQPFRFHDLLLGIIPSISRRVP